MLRQLIAAGAAIVSILISACAPANPPTLVTVRNAASEPIVMLTIDVSAQHLKATNLAPGATTTLPYSIGVESDYDVVATFASGRSIEKHVGYVDAGLNSHDYLDVYIDHIDFKPYTPKDSSHSSSSVLAP
jgi:hypothetical protein